jgi:hypothetical protein
VVWARAGEVEHTAAQTMKAATTVSLALGTMLRTSWRRRRI